MSLDSSSFSSLESVNYIRHQSKSKSFAIIWYLQTSYVAEYLDPLQLLSLYSMKHSRFGFHQIASSLRLFDCFSMLHPLPLGISSLHSNSCIRWFMRTPPQFLPSFVLLAGQLLKVFLGHLILFESDHQLDPPHSSNALHHSQRTSYSLPNYCNTSKMVSL